MEGASTSMGIDDACSGEQRQDQSYLAATREFGPARRFRLRLEANLGSLATPHRMRGKLDELESLISGRESGRQAPA
jgi:hypothetical protein